MDSAGKPLSAQAREAAKVELGAVCRTATAARNRAESGVGCTAVSLLEEITEMEAALGRLRKTVNREL